MIRYNWVTVYVCTTKNLRQKAGEKCPQLKIMQYFFVCFEVRRFGDQKWPRRIFLKFVSSILLYLWVERVEKSRESSSEVAIEIKVGRSINDHVQDNSSCWTSGIQSVRWFEWWRKMKQKQFRKEWELRLYSLRWLSEGERKQEKKHLRRYSKGIATVMQTDVPLRQHDKAEWIHLQL